MPNWCENSLTITLPKKPSKTQKTFFEKLKKRIRYMSKNNIKGKPNRKGLFQTFRPLPKSKEKDWYDWHVKNWGTKWDIYEFISATTDKYVITIDFLSAWSPPVDFYEYLHKKSKLKIEADYEEIGIGFNGTWVNGIDTCCDI